MVAWVASTGQPLLANDVNAEPRYLPHHALPDTQAELTVSLKIGEGVIGVLDLQSAANDARFFTGKGRRRAAIRAAFAVKAARGCRLLYQ